MASVSKGNQGLRPKNVRNSTSFHQRCSYSSCCYSSNLSYYKIKRQSEKINGYTFYFYTYACRLSGGRIFWLKFISRRSTGTAFCCSIDILRNRLFWYCKAKESEHTKHVRSMESRCDTPSYEQHYNNAAFGSIGYICMASSPI